MKEYYRTHPEYREYQYQRQRAKYDEAKKSILDILGRECAKCDFDDERALQIDHVNGGGCKSHKNGYTYRYLQKILADPAIRENYEVLCANHNWIKRVEQNELNRRNVRSLQKEILHT